MKKLCFLLPLLLIGVTACHDHDALAELETLKAGAELEHQNKAIVEKYIEAWNNKDLQGIAALQDPQDKFYLPSNAEDPMNAEQFRTWYESIYKGFPDVNYEILDLLADGNKVTVRWEFTGTHNGDFAGIPATGNRVVGAGIEIFTIKDGKIVEERGETDSGGFMQQMGL
jgi:steroid delta-isomerase-like uncharacterized protein